MQLSTAIMRKQQMQFMCNVMAENMSLAESLSIYDLLTMTKCLIRNRKRLLFYAFFQHFTNFEIIKNDLYFRLYFIGMRRRARFNEIQTEKFR